MPKFRKKPVEIEAVQWTGLNKSEINHFCRDLISTDPDETKISYNGGNIYIETLEGTMKVDKLDWIIKGVEGEFYPCKPGIFDKTYESVEDK